MSLVLAHAGHWLEGIAFGAPVLATPAALALYVLRERRRERRSQISQIAPSRSSTG